MAKKRVLGLDTGSNSLGWAIVDREESGEQTLGHSCKYPWLIFVV